MKTIYLLLCLLVGSSFNLMAQSRWSFDVVSSYDINIASSIRSVEGKPLEVKWSSRWQYGLGLMNSSPMRFFDAYIRLHAHRRGLTYKIDDKVNYASSIGIMPEVGAQFKLTPFSFQDPTRGRWVINTGVGYNIPLMNSLNEDDKRGLPIDYPKGFFMPGAELTIGLGYDLRKSEHKESYSGSTRTSSTFRGHLYFGIDYVRGLGNFFMPEHSGLKGNASYLRLKLVMGGL